jgi:hypothetical protein
MQIKRDVFRIESGAREADGTKIAPEAQNAVHVFEGTTPVNIPMPGVNPVGTAGSVPLEIVAHSTAGQLARSVAAMCIHCKHFDRAGWLKMLARNEGAMSTAAERHSINSIRAEILMRMPEPESHTGTDGDYDIEHAMKAMGLCHVLREFYNESKQENDIIGVWPTAGCPEEVATAVGKPQGLFVPRDGDAEAASTQGYDAVMLRAAGVVP